MASVYLLDASPYIFRAYYSLPSSIQTPEGAPANAVLGFTEFLIQLIQKAKPTHLAAAFDGSLSTSFRNKIYPAYKANRSLPPPELEEQLSNCYKVAEGMGVVTFIDEELEADDIIGTLVEKLADALHEVVIVSSDKDLTQLVGKGVRLWDFARDIWFDAEAVQMKFGVKPTQMVDLLALIGDSVDNIPGVKGVGPKTSVELIRVYSSLENIYRQIDSVSDLSIRGASTVQKRLSEHKETAFLSKRLATLVTDAPLAVELKKLQYRGARRGFIEPLLDRFGFERIRMRIPVWADSEK